MTTSRKTSFQDVQDEVIRRIQDRIWPQGSLLPTEFELAEEFGCARATVNRALRELAEKGIIDRKRKSGTRVVTAPVKQAVFEIAVVRHTIEERNADYRYALVHRSVDPIPAWLGARLDLPQGAQVVRVKCMHYADNRPFQFEDRWINIATVPDVVGADFSDRGPNEWLLEQVPFTDAEIAMTAVPADAQLSEFLAAPENTPLLQMERTTWLKGAPVTFVRMTYHPGYRMQTRY
ncbi:MAG: UTRA domain-containing protein [Rhodobacteraceae bacterium]|nr:UTRA domain-containing protein [Paracoccaceae bacterium]